MVSVKKLVSTILLSSTFVSTSLNISAMEEISSISDNEEQDSKVIITEEKKDILNADTLCKDMLSLIHESVLLAVSRGKISDDSNVSKISKNDASKILSSCDENERKSIRKYFWKAVRDYFEVRNKFPSYSLMQQRIKPIAKPFVERFHEFAEKYKGILMDCFDIGKDNQLVLDSRTNLYACTPVPCLFWLFDQLASLPSEYIKLYYDPYGEYSGKKPSLRYDYVDETKMKGSGKRLRCIVKMPKDIAELVGFYNRNYNPDTKILKCRLPVILRYPNGEEEELEDVATGTTEYRY